MDFVRQVVEKELRNVNRDLDMHKSDKAELEFQLECKNKSIAQAEKHKAELEAYLNPLPIAQNPIVTINLDGKEVGKAVAESLERQVELGHFFKGNRV